MINVSILGATGYTGFELVKLLIKHKSINISMLTSESYVGKKISDVYPVLTKQCDIVLIDNDIDAVIKSSDAVFCCLPHGASMAAAEKIYNAGKIVIDLSADFRIDDVTLYEKTYNVKHTASDLLKKSVYGLPELFRDKIKTTKIIASPGCYPTSVITPLYPLIKENLIDINNIFIDSKSGVSGAGRKPSATNIFCEVNEDFKPYAILTHRHNAEINHILSKTGSKIDTVFTPHLLPINRGILSTIYTNTTTDLDAVYKIWNDYFKTEKLVRIRTGADIPAIKNVANTPFIDFAAYIKGNKLVIVSAIDNLLKGASSQALQSLNIILGLDELEGVL